MTPPSIVAFAITPTSGAAPYVYTAQFSNKEMLSTGEYFLQAVSQTTAGSCVNPAASGTSNPTIVTSILNTGQYTNTFSVPVGSCSVVALQIRRVSDNVIVSRELAQISNLE